MIDLAAADFAAEQARKVFSELELEARAVSVRGRKRRRTSTWWLYFGAAKALVHLKERAVNIAREQLERFRGDA